MWRDTVLKVILETWTDKQKNDNDADTTDISHMHNTLNAARLGATPPFTQSTGWTPRAVKFDTAKLHSEAGLSHLLVTQMISLESYSFFGRSYGPAYPEHNTHAVVIGRQGRTWTSSRVTKPLGISFS